MTTFAPTANRPAASADTPPRAPAAARPAALEAAPAAVPAAPLAGPAAGLALALHAAVLSQPTSAAAAQALVVALARQLTFDRVWLAWSHGQRLQLAARSDGVAVVQGTTADPQQRQMLAAAAECFDQSAAVAWPPPLAAAAGAPADAATDAAAPPRVTRAHAALAAAWALDIPPPPPTPAAPLTTAAATRAPPRAPAPAFQDTLPAWADDDPPAGPLSSPPSRTPRAAAAPHPATPARPTASSGCAASVPLVVDGQRVGVIGIHRRSGAALGNADLQQLQHLACLVAPLLWLLQRNERGWRQRSLDALRLQWLRAGTQRRQQLQALALLAATGALVALLLPWPAQVGGPARLQGAIQRVLAAPADGYVQHVHARAGDTVRAGQPLLELADQDLQLEKQRWQSQLSQHLDALATAQARADRTQLVLQQSRADEAQAQLALTEERLQRARLVAPFDAVVVQGDWSQQLGAPVKEGTELMTLAPRDRYRVIVEIDERDIGALHAPEAGAPVHGTLALSALPWDTLALRVTRVSPLAKAVEGRNVFEVEAELLDSPAAVRAGLRPGLQGTARLQAAHTSPLLHLLRRGLGAARVAWWEWWG